MRKDREKSPQEEVEIFLSTKNLKKLVNQDRTPICVQSTLDGSENKEENLIYIVPPKCPFGFKLERIEKEKLKGGTTVYICVYTNPPAREKRLEAQSYALTKTQEKQYEENLSSVI